MREQTGMLTVSELFKAAFRAAYDVRVATGGLSGNEDMDVYAPLSVDEIAYVWERLRQGCAYYFGDAEIAVMWKSWSCADARRRGVSL